MVNFGLLTAEIRWRVWGTPANFNGFRVLARVGKNHDFFKSKKSDFFLFKSDFFDLNQIFFYFFVQASNTRGWQVVQMLYDDVINDKDYVGFKSVTEDWELRKYIRR